MNNFSLIKILTFRQFVIFFSYVCGYNLGWTPEYWYNFVKDRIDCYDCFFESNTKLTISLDDSFNILVYFEFSLNGDKYTVKQLGNKFVCLIGLVQNSKNTAFLEVALYGLPYLIQREFFAQRTNSAKAVYAILTNKSGRSKAINEWLQENVK